MSTFRILMLNNEYPPLGGGTASVTEEILRHFQTFPDLTVDLITASGDAGQRHEQLSSNVRVFWVPVPVQCLHHARNSELLHYSFRALRLAQQLHVGKPYDVTLAFSSVPAGLTALCLFKWFGLPYLVRLSGPDIPGFEKRYSYLNPVLRPVVRAVWRNARAVVAKCVEEEDLARKTFRSLRAIRVRNGVDSDRFSPLPALRTGETVKILCAARLIQRKGQSMLMDATAELLRRGWPVRLVLAGTGDEEKAYRAQAAELLIDSHVEFRGYVPREDMPTLYREADIFALPSANEGMSVAMLEALASGLPLVVSDVGGVREVVTHGENGFIFDKNDTGALTESLEMVVSRADLRRELQKNARIRAELFSWKQVAEQLLMVLKAASAS